MRADPVHLRLQRDKLLLLPVLAQAGEAGLLCASLNEYFAGRGMMFYAPHPNRWYVRLDCVPKIDTTPLSQVEGRCVRAHLPKGGDALHWLRIYNEIQMLLFAHPVNEAREASGELPLNSLWLWGCGSGAAPQKNYEQTSSDEELTAMLAEASGTSHCAWAAQWSPVEGRQLLVWTGLRKALQQQDYEASRSTLQQFETGYAQPLWQALRCGKISQLHVDILGTERMTRLVPLDAWAFWRRRRPLSHYASS